LRQELFASDLTVAEVAHILGRDRATVLRFLEQNLIFGFKLGRRWHIPESSLREYAAALHDTARKAPSADEKGSSMNTTEADLDEIEGMAILVARYRETGHLMSVAYRAGDYLQSHCMATRCGSTLRVQGAPPFPFAVCLATCMGDPIVEVPS
jgi:excisionase family DNA binding protein